MKRVVDKPYFYSFIDRSKNEGVLVKCPKCQGHGIVTVSNDMVQFRCLKCGYQKKKERAIYRYSVNTHCEHCGRYYRTDIEDEQKQHFPTLRVACPYCGTTNLGKVHKALIGERYYGDIENGREPWLGLELWYLTYFQGKPVWALNEKHLEYLIDYLSADIIEKPINQTIKTQADRIPTFMKTAKHRDQIVKLLKGLKEKDKDL